MDFVWKLYGNTYAVHVTVALVGVATLNLALPAPLGLSGDMPLKGVAKSASWYNDDPLFSAKTGINMGHIFKIF